MSSDSHQPAGTRLSPTHRIISCTCGWSSSRRRRNGAWMTLKKDLRLHLERTARADAAMRAHAAELKTLARVKRLIEEWWPKSGPTPRQGSSVWSAPDGRHVVVQLRIHGASHVLEGTGKTWLEAMRDVALRAADLRGLGP